MKKSLAFIFACCLSSQVFAAPSEREVITHYTDLAHTIYGDSLLTARELLVAVEQLIASPTEQNLQVARDAWKAARVPYQQSEAFRFGNPIVDDWEGKVNAWPLDEGLIDYVAASYGDESDENYFYTANIIANKKIDIGGDMIDATHITKALLSETLHEIDDVETNVATGYHAIEFLLWGQDLNGTGPGAGNRPASDFDVKNCMVGHCDRRGEYLKAVTELLVDELAWMVEQWDTNGEARANLLEGDSKAAVAAIFSGMGSLSYGELAGERMKLGLMVHDPEEEPDCFSDNTHASHYNDALSIKNVYTGSYTRVNGEKVSGPNASQLVEAVDAELNQQLLQALDNTLAKMQVLVDSAEKEGVAYDQLIGHGNTEGNGKVMAAISALLAQTKVIEKAVVTLSLDGLAFEGSDSLDNPDSVMH